MAIYLKNKVRTRKVNKKTKTKCSCDLVSLAETRVNGRLKTVDAVYECTCKTKKRSLLNEKDNSFAIRIDSYSTNKLTKVVKTAKRAGLKIRKFDDVVFGDYLIIGKTDHYDLIATDDLTGYLVGTEPEYSLASDYSTILAAIKEYAKKEVRRNTSVNSTDLIVTDDWVFVNGALIDKNSASDVVITKKKKELYIPGILSY